MKEPWVFHERIDTYFYDATATCCASSAPT
jgi:hypothetical protein